MKIQVHKFRNISHPLPVFAWLIMLFQGMLPWRKDSYSHMGISVEISGVTQFIDASFNGVHRTNSEEFLKIYGSIESIEIKHNLSEMELQKWYSKHLGKKYDFIQLVGLFVRELGLFKRNSVGHNTDKLICCELIVMLIDHIKDRNKDTFDSDKWNLKDTWNLANKWRVK